MSSRQTWFWAAVAACLGITILLVRSNSSTHTPGAKLVLAELKPKEVSSVTFRPPGPAQLEIRVDRTNDSWRMLSPLNYPAQATSIESLLIELSRLTPATFIGPEPGKAAAEDRYGFTSSQASTIIIHQRDYLIHLVIGMKTAPGDQVFVQVVGRDGAYVVDAGLLKFLPKSANDWRDTSLVTFRTMAFDRVAVTNGTRVFELQRQGASRVWQMVRPFQTRAHHAKIEESLGNLEALQVQKFVSDDPEADLEAFGLQPPQIAIWFGSGTNTAQILHFGKSPTNDLEQVYACRAGEKTVVLVPKEPLTPWRAAVSDFRDPYLLTLTEPVYGLHVKAEEEFTIVQRNGTNEWRVMPQNYPADVELLTQTVSLLGSLQITQYVKDVVTDADLPAYSLAPPNRQYILRSEQALLTNAPTVGTIATLQFGLATNQEDRVFARRTDESCVYAVAAADFRKLPSYSWELRDRNIWSFTVDDVSSVVVQQQSRQRVINRNGKHDWALAPGSSGVINDLAVEETVRAISQVKPEKWAGVGLESRDKFGIPGQAHKLTIQLRDERKVSVEFGNESPTGLRYAAVELDGNTWIFEFPWVFYRDIAQYLNAP